MREIATVQLGSYANYVGAHFWNFQGCFMLAQCVALRRRRALHFLDCPRPSGDLVSHEAAWYSARKVLTRHTISVMGINQIEAVLVDTMPSGDLVSHEAAWYSARKVLTRHTISVMGIYQIEAVLVDDELLGLAGDMEADPVFQQSGLDMDMLYRVGETRQRVATYTPRLVAVDLRGSLGAIRSSGSLHDGTPESDSSTLTSWSGRVSTHRAEPSKKNEFLQRLESEESGQLTDTEDEKVVHSLQNGVHYWTDYLKVQLHPRSVYEIEGVWNGVTPFEDFGSGKQLFTESFRLEEFQDRFRLVAEECDHMQGIQVFVDDSGGFSGVASDILVDLEDDYGDISLMLFTVRPPEVYPEESRSVKRVLHDAVSFASLASFGNIVVPVGLPQLATSNFARYLKVQNAKPFHSSAVYAVAIHNATLPFRMVSASSQVGNCAMGTLLKNLSYANRKVAHLDAALPAPVVPGHGSRQGLDLSILGSLTPDVLEGCPGDHAAESMVIQGARLAGLKGPASVSQVLDSLHGQKSKQGVLLSHLALSPCPLAVPLPFPCIFGSSIGQYGDILADASTSNIGRGGLDVVSVPVATRLRTDDAILPYLKRRLTDLEQLGTKRGAVGSSVLAEWGLANEDAQELREALSDLVGHYGETLTEMDSD